MGAIIAAFKLIAGFFGFLHDRKVEQAVEDRQTVETQKKVLEAVKDAKNIANKPLSDDLLVSPDQRGHNHD